mgnify:CR=1 FL=1
MSGPPTFPLLPSPHPNPLATFPLNPPDGQVTIDAANLEALEREIRLARWMC